MGTKVIFDSVNKIIQVTEAPVNGIVDIDVKIDIYSDGKEDWLSDATLNKFLFPVTAVGGDPLPGSKALGSTFFLEYGWVIRPYEADHTMQVNGNLYSRDDDSPYITTQGNFNVFTIQSVSSLVDSTVQQLSEIEHSVFNDGVTIDVANGYAGTSYPVGTSGRPSNNILDAQTIAAERGFSKLFVRGNLTLNSDAFLVNFTIIGQNAQITQVVIDAAAVVSNTEFRECMLTGDLDGGSVLRSGVAANLNFINGFLFEVMLEGTLTLGGNNAAYLFNCFSGTPGQGTPTIDMGGSGQALALRGYNGGIKLINKTGNEDVSLDFVSGQAIIDSTVTDGDIVIRGVAKVTDNSTGTAIVYSEGLVPTAQENARVVWEYDAAVVASGSTGEIQRRLSFQNHIHVSLNDGVAGTTYPLGTHDHPVNNIADAVLIGNIEGIALINIAEDITIFSTDNVDGFTIQGGHATKSEIIVEVGASTQLTQFFNCTLTGTMNGRIIIRESVTNDIINFEGVIFQTVIKGFIRLSATNNAVSYILQSFSGVPGVGTPELDFNFTGHSVAVRDYSGGIKITNKSSPEPVSFDFASGQIIIDGTVTNGEIVVRGVYHLEDNSNGSPGITLIQNTNLDNMEIKIDNMQIDVDVIEVTVGNMSLVIDDLIKYQRNKSIIDPIAFTLTIFQDDGTTPLTVFDLKDENGVASILSIFQRIPR